MDENKVMVFVIYDRAIDEEIGDALEDLGVRYHTKWKDVSGVGVHDPHLGDNIWPGLNNVIMAVVDETTKNRILARVKDLQANYASAGLRAFVTPLIEMA